MSNTAKDDSTDSEEQGIDVFELLDGNSVLKNVETQVEPQEPEAEICSNPACKKIILGHSHYVWTYPLCCECFDEWAVETILSINGW